MITNFPTNPLTNMAGLQAFSFAPYQDVSAIPPVVAKLIATPVTFASGGFLTGYATIGTLQFTEKFIADNDGGYYDWLVTGFTPGDTDELVDLMEEMKYSRYLLLTNDHNRVLRLVGIDAPLAFSADYDSGKTQGSDAKGYTLNFTGTSRLRAPRYNLV